MKTLRQKLKKLRRIQNTKRVIAKRLKIVKESWRMNFRGYEEKHPWEEEPNRVNKHNLNCGCKMCQIKGPDVKKLRDDDRYNDSVSEKYEEIK